MDKETGYTILFFSACLVLAVLSMIQSCQKMNESNTPLISKQKLKPLKTEAKVAQEVDSTDVSIEDSLIVVRVKSPVSSPVTVSGEYQGVLFRIDTPTPVDSFTLKFSGAEQCRKYWRDKGFSVPQRIAQGYIVNLGKGTHWRVE